MSIPRQAQTTLITGGGVKSRNDRAKKVAAELLNEPAPKYDLFVIDSEKIKGDEDRKSVGIEHSRKLISWLKEKPLQHKVKVGLILEADALTTEAQNALLKTLEEPPASAYLILTTAKKTGLLPTIISRCRLVSLGNLEAILTKVSPVEIFSQPGIALDFIAGSKELLEDRETVWPLLETWEGQLRSQLLSSNGDKVVLTAALERLWELRQTLKNTTVSLRLALEEYLINS